MVSDPFGSDITFSVRSNGRRLHITVTNDVLINRFGANDGDRGIIKALARYAPVLSWMAFAKAAVEDTDVVRIDQQTFDHAESQSLAAATLAKAQNAPAFLDTEQVALECLHDTTADDLDGSLDIAAAIGLFLVRTAACMKHGNAQEEQVGAESWIFYALFSELEKTRPGT